MSYEKAPRRKAKRETGNKTIFVERKPTGEERDCQIPRFLARGYVENKELSSDRVMAMDIPYKEYYKRADDREEKTTKALLTPPPSGIPGEFSSTATLMDRKTAEQFLDEDEDDSD